MDCKAMEVNEATKNSDESDFSGNQTLEPRDDQGSMMVPNGSQNVSGDRAFTVSNSSSNVNNALNSEPNVSNVLNESGSLDTDAMLIQSPKLLKKANITSTSSNAKGSTDATNNDNNSAIGGSFLKNLFEINGPAYQSINELLEKYPYLPYYSLFSLLTASTGRESVERMLEWTRNLQAKQVTITKEAVKNKEYMTEVQLLKAYGSEDEYQQLSAYAGISPSGSESQIKSTLSECEKVIIISIATFIPVVGLVFFLLSPLLKLVANSIEDPSKRAKFKETVDLLNGANAVAEFIVMIAELFTDDEATLQKVRLIARIVMTIIFSAVIAVLTLGGYLPSALATIMVLISGFVNGVVQIAQAVYTLSTLEKQKNVAKRRLELETAIAYCEKLQKDLDIIASEIDMIVELFTAAMDKIRAEYDRISRMIKETSDVKNMIARNIGA
jgi:hypothetical protein